VCIAKLQAALRKALTTVTMYEKFFGFLDLPFRVTPEPRYFYSNSIYQEALATLRYGIEARKGFIVITGEVGTGKTTLLKLFMQSADPNIHTAFIFNPSFTFTELLRLILKDLGMPHSADDKFTLMQQFNDYLLEQLKQDQIVAVLIDEAQTLTDDVLEDLRLFSNVETDKHKLIQIVLMGQPELEQRLDQPQLRQIKQRVALRCCVDPLRSHEIRRYINFRLKTAGYDGEELFDANAIERITLYSAGIPRLINVICDNALRIAYGLSKTKVSAEMIEQVACDLQLPAPRQIPDPAAVRKPASRAERTSDQTEPRDSQTKGRAGWFDWDRSPTWINMGFLIALVVLVGAALYFQKDPRDLVATVRDNKSSFNPVEPDRPYTAASAAQSNQPHVAQLNEPGSAGRIVNEPERGNVQGVEWADNKPAQVRSDTRTDKEQRAYVGNFTVVGKTLLFNKPQRQSAIVTTLWPGMRVRVEGKTENYLRVRSLKHPEIKGYVHPEHAYLERLDYPSRPERTRPSRLQDVRSDSFALGPMIKSMLEKMERDYKSGYGPVAEKPEYK
jgi:general secretion pathway protein A